MSRQRLLEMKLKTRNKLKSAGPDYNPYKKQSTNERPATISILNPEGNGLSDDVEKMLRERLLGNNLDATAPIYEAVGMVRDSKGVWGYPTEDVADIQPSQMPVEPRAEEPEGDDTSSPEEPTEAISGLSRDQVAAIKRQVLRSRKSGV